MPLLDDLLRHARDRPHDPAALDPTRSLDWTGLLEEVAAAATGLAAQDVGPGDRVGLHLPNSVDFLVAALATWWRGATFVPLDFSSPAARVASLVEDCEPAVVVTAAEDPVAAGLVGPPVPTLAALRSSASPWGPPVTADAPAYLIYTSGTTGAPKGVVIGHAALDAALSALVEIVDVGPSSRAACVSPFHFDGSFGTLFATLHAGGLVTIPTRGEVLFPRNFLRWIDAHAVDLTGFTPTYLRLLAAGRALPALGPGPLRMLAVGGEALSAADVIGLLGAAPQLRVFNRYGPTETTIAVAHHRLYATDLAAGEPVPVGRPHPGSSFHILGDDLQPVPTGTPGELWIGGAQLMDGYWRAPEPTVAVLRSDVVTGDLVYKTGDLVRADAEGVVTWLDRVDRVVKRRGVRISLAELTDALSGIGAVHAAAALARGPAPDTEILAFVVAEPADLPGVRTALAARLPEAMLPDRIVAVASMPLTNSGKLDEQALLGR